MRWNVTFPAGFHDMLYVELQAFTGEQWQMLESLKIWAEFENAGTSMDWEFCIDDMEIEFPSDEDIRIETEVPH